MRGAGPVSGPQQLKGRVIWHPIRGASFVGVVCPVVALRLPPANRWQASGLASPTPTIKALPLLGRPICSSGGTARSASRTGHQCGPCLSKCKKTEEGPSVGGGHDEDLLEGRDAFAGAVEGDHAEGPHALTD